MIKKTILALTIALVAVLSVSPLSIAQEKMPVIVGDGGGEGGGGGVGPLAPTPITWQILSDPSSQITQSGSTVVFAGFSNCQPGGAQCAANIVSNEHFGFNNNLTDVRFVVNGSYNLPYMIIVQPVDHSKPAAAIISTYNPGTFRPYFSFANERSVQDGDVIRMVVSNGTVTYWLNAEPIYSHPLEAQATGPYELFVQFLWYSPASLRDAGF